VALSKLQISLEHGATKGCLSLLTTCAIVYEPKCGGGGEMRGLRLSQLVQQYTRAKINFGDLTPYLTYGLEKNLRISFTCGSAEMQPSSDGASFGHRSGLSNSVHGLANGHSCPLCALNQPISEAESVFALIDNAFLQKN
jgi:hypothetical protein